MADSMRILLSLSFCLLTHLLMRCLGVWQELSWGSWYSQHPDLVWNFFPQSVLYWHASPPAIQFLMSFLGSLDESHRTHVLYVALAIWHGIAFSGFWKAMNGIFKGRQLLCFLLSALAMFNPGNMVLFGELSGTTLIAGLMCILLGAWKRPVNQFALIYVLVLLVMSFSRASFSLPVCIILIILLLVVSKPNNKFHILCLLPLFFILPLKNYAFFGHFGSNSWQWRNLAAHIPHDDQTMWPHTFENRFKTIDFFLENDSLTDFTINKSEVTTHPVLNQSDFNNIGFLKVESNYRHAVLSLWSFSYSLKVSVYGFFTYFSHPIADNIYLMQNLSPAYRGHWFFKLGDLPNMQAGSKGSELRLSWFLFLWLGVGVVILFNIKHFPGNLKLLALHVVLFSLLYSIVDPNEANRMRLEVEPVFWFFSFFLFSKLNLKIFSPKCESTYI
jgi:hypothetical protein